MSAQIVVESLFRDSVAKFALVIALAAFSRRVVHWWAGQMIASCLQSSPKQNASPVGRNLLQTVPANKPTFRSGLLKLPPV